MSRCQHLDAVEPLLEEQTSGSTTDPDAKLMKHLNGAREVSHNVQIAVDEKAHIVASVDVTSDEVDYQQFYPVSMQAKGALGVEKDVYVCPQGKELPRKKKRNANSVEVYYGSKKLCADCPVRDLCTKGSDGRTIMRGLHQKAGDDAIRRMYEKSRALQESGRTRTRND